MKDYLVYIEPEENHYKDYEIEQSGNVVICKWGRIDASKQIKSFSFETPEQAKLFYYQKVREKFQKGYKNGNPLSIAKVI